MMKPSDMQVSGNHYKKYAIQPAEFCQKNRLTWCEANAVKYLMRHRDKKGAEDIKKAIHYLNLLLEWEYPLESVPPSPGDITDAERERVVRCLDRNMSVEVEQNKGGNNGR